MAQILIVDDEMGIRELLSEILEDEGHSVVLAEDAAAARKYRLEHRPDLVLLDIWMPDTDGISLLREWSAARLLNMPVVMMSGHGTIDSAVEATRVGAVGFLEKPISMQKLLMTVKKALQQEVSAQKPPPPPDVFAHSPLLRDLRKRLEQAVSKKRVLLLKNVSGGVAEICARTLRLPRTPWLDMSALCAPLTHEMLTNNSGGILFVAELMSLDKLQQKNLAYVIDRQERHKLRLVVASMHSREALIEAGWEPGLTGLLSEIWIALPQLSGHTEDVPYVAALMLSYLAERSEVPARVFSAAALNAFRLYNWSGEWTELLSAVKNLAILALEDEIAAEDVSSLLQHGEKSNMTAVYSTSLFNQTLREAREAFERMYFEYHLRNEYGNMTRIAEKTGLERTHLYRKLKQLGLTRSGQNSSD